MAFFSGKRLGAFRAIAACAVLLAPNAWAQPYMSEIRWVAFNFAPRGWANCNGALLSIQQNQALFSLLGTTYGGDGRTNFALPDMRGRGPIHEGDNGNGNVHTLGEKGGEESHTLNINEMPAHTHALKVDPHEATVATPDSTTTYLAKTSGGTSAYASTANTSLNPTSVSSVGGNQPHNNMKPYIALNCIIALQGVFPSQN